MPPRKGHKKTRTGCFQCRKRKVKCDEEKPRCSNCVRRIAPCTYPVELPLFSDLDSSPHPSDFQSGTTSHASEEVEEGLPSLKILTLPPISAYELDINVLHLELMHNFSTSTCFTLSNNDELKEIWRTTIPRMAFSHTCILRAMLALSALHVAYFRPEKRDIYEQFFTLHYEPALREGASLIANITDENCSAGLAFSLLATLNSLAAPRKDSTLLLVGEKGITSWLYTIRGMGQIARSSWERILSSGMGPLVRIAIRDLEQGEEAPPEAAALKSLKASLERTGGESCSANIAAVDKLLGGFKAIHHRSKSACELPAVLTWPSQVPDQYVDLLTEREPWSLVVLAYFCVLMKRGDSMWWMEGWSVHVLAHVYQLLDEEHRLAMRWPMEMIGWVPPDW